MGCNGSGDGGGERQGKPLGTRQGCLGHFRCKGSREGGTPEHYEYPLHLPNLEGRGLSHGFEPKLYLGLRVSRLGSHTNGPTPAATTWGWGVKRESFPSQPKALNGRRVSAVVHAGVGSFVLFGFVFFFPSRIGHSATAEIPLRGEDRGGERKGQGFVSIAGFFFFLGGGGKVGEGGGEGG